jgi:hypothetical protein
MKLAQYLKMKSWTPSIFSKKANIPCSLITKVLKESGCVSLGVALQIEIVSEGCVTAWDLCPYAEKIKYGKWDELVEKRKHKKKDEQGSQDDKGKQDQQNGAHGEQDIPPELCNQDISRIA